MLPGPLRFLLTTFASAITVLDHRPLARTMFACLGNISLEKNHRAEKKSKRSLKHQGYEDMKQFGDTMMCLSGITLRLFEDDFRDLHSEAWECNGDANGKSVARYFHYGMNEASAQEYVLYEYEYER